MLAALLQTDLTAQRWWLSFTRPAPMAVRRALSDAGWEYHRRHRAWFHDETLGRIPRAVAVGQGGACEYTAQRGRRGYLRARATLLSLIEKQRR